jgi:RHS repeat-associated protein
LTAANLSHRYLWGPAVDQILADERVAQSNGQATTQEVLFPLADQLGSVRDVAKMSGGTTSIVDHIIYNSFGQATSESNPSQGCLSKFTGRATDNATDIEFHGARVRLAGSPDWMSEDPSGIAGGGDANLYSYCGNSPTNATDPTGLRETDDRWTTLTKQLVDVTSKVEGEVNSVIATEWYTSQTPGRTAAQAAAAVCNGVFMVLGEDDPSSTIYGFSPIAKMGMWLDTNLSVANHEIVTLAFSQTRYHRNDTSIWNIRRRPWLVNETTANHGIAPVIRIGGTPGTTNGTVVGTDKFEHFFQQGYWLFDVAYGQAGIYLKATVSGMPNFTDPKIRLAFSEWMEGVSSTVDPLIGKYSAQFAAVANYFGMPLGEGGYGSASTGIISWADIQAGLDGYSFYESMYQAFMSNASNVYQFSLSNYDVAKWNEQTNPNSWSNPPVNRDDDYVPALPPGFSAASPPVSRGDSQ